MNAKLRNARPRAVARGLLTLVVILPMTATLPDVPLLAVSTGDDQSLKGGTRDAWSWAAIARAETGKAEPKVRYTCPMHPHYISDHPGGCPICGMDLVKMEPAATSGPAQAEGRETVTIAPEILQNMGVRIAPAEKANFGRTVRSTAMVMENERMRSVITARVEGWVEDLKVTAVGDPVKRGMKLFELYAPELVVSQRDYLTAMREKDQRRLADTETRLRAFGVQDQAMQQLASGGREMQRVPFFADRDGVVAELPVVNGEYLKRGTTVLRIQDYATVWLIASVAEKDLAFLGKDTPARVTFPNMPGHAFQTKVDYIYPTIDPKTRTGRVRLIVENLDGIIRPGSYADVSFEVDGQPRLAVPSDAVLRSQSGSYVILALGEGRFAPRPIEVGLAGGRWTEVTRGLSSGQNVVVSGQFLIDSESALRESFRKLERLQMPLALLSLDKSQLAMVDHIVDAALYLHEALVDGYTVDAKFLQPARDIKALLWPRFGTTKLGFVLEDAEGALEKAQAARSESEVMDALGLLVAAIKPWILQGAPRHYSEKGLVLFEDAGSGRKWLQLGDTVLNPFGSGKAVRVPLAAAAREAEKSQEEAPASGKPSVSTPPSEMPRDAHQHGAGVRG